MAPCAVSIVVAAMYRIASEGFDGIEVPKAGRPSRGVWTAGNARSLQKLIGAKRKPLDIFSI